MLSLPYRIYGLPGETHIWQIIITKGEEYVDPVSTGWNRSLARQKAFEGVKDLRKLMLVEGEWETALEFEEESCICIHKALKG